MINRIYRRKDAVNNLPETWKEIVVEEGDNALETTRNIDKAFKKAGEKFKDYYLRARAGG